MRYLSLPEILDLHRRIVAQSGGPADIRDLGLLESALAQPRMTFGGQELYPTLAGKAAALGFSLIKNHPFADGNKRVGHAAMEVFLVLNNSEIGSAVEEQERVILQLASGEIGRETFAEWVRDHVVKKT